MKVAKEYIITICDGTGCIQKGNAEIRKALEQQIKDRNLTDDVHIHLSGCLGMCEKGPVVVINPGYTVYGSVTPADIQEIVEEHLVNGRPVARLAIQEDHLYNRFFRIFGDAKFFGKQMRIALRNCGIIDPENIDDYLSLRGYEALAKVLTDMTPKQVIEEVKLSGLRGRGGAGFPTGVKWQVTARAGSPNSPKSASDEKYVICNADEGDPGAFMDRSAIEGDPHTVLEGMIIGGYAIGAKQGIVYIRAEYPLAVHRLEKAIADAREHGFLGKNILGSDFSFDIDIRLGAGAFVCGEETALIRSIEGGRGMPRPRPPYPSVEGLFGKPTLINNVETWANIPVVILDSGKWFSTVGTERSKGTKVFALAGKVVNTGLIEVPMGTTLREIIYDIGGGIPDNKKFKAVQTGGPSGGCLPAKYLDTPVDYESLAKAGSIMGSGGMIVIDQDSCMVDIAKFFLEFTQNESCGKCTPCREGTKRMLDILIKITEGKGEMYDIENLERLGNMIKKASLCGLGQSAPNPVLSTILNFREEYEEHVKDKKCRAGVCKQLLTYEITDKCVGCGLCRKNCPVTAISGTAKAKHTIDQNKCIKCGVCFSKCKFDAIIKK
ncbi:MAG: NADH-quinone oxidoreductase subunit NuoF [Sedimentisphaerales bacterium]|jgi:NADH:ubiquinone oxidoreductase subunit F (NADH-binding)/(2Fe-2S) ferredoxin/NAD-dependent dihydropyrimidine dehydrogenase PreA subunit